MGRMVEDMKPQEAVDEYLRRLSTKLARPTLRALSYALSVFLRSFHMGNIADLQVEAVEVFVRDALIKEYSRSTANLYAVALRGFVKHLLADGKIDWTAANVARMDELLADLRPKRKSRLPKLPSPEDVDAIRAAAERSTLPTPFRERNIALIETLYSTGCRIDEVVRLKVKDIDLNNREARIIGKGDKERVVFFSPKAVNACILYWRVRRHTSSQGVYQGDPAFCRHDDGAAWKTKPFQHLTTQGARDVVLELAKVAGLSHFTPHSFRHYFATKMLEETSDLSIVQDALGHESPETTRVYAKVNPEIVRRAHKEVFGK